MADASEFHGGAASRGFRWSNVPWQLWVVSALLALEGVLGNLPMMFSQPVAAVWLAAKVLFITGFMLRWRPVFVLFLIIGGLHVLAFAAAAPFVAFLNLAMVVLVASCMRWFFPRAARASSE